MKVIVFAAVIAGVVGLLAYEGLTLAGISVDLSGNLAQEVVALTLLGLIKYLGTRSKEPNLSISPPDIVPFQGYTLRRYFMVAYGASIFFAVITLMGLLAAIIGIVVRTEPASVPDDIFLFLGMGGLNAAFVAPIVNASLAYLIAMWVGIRCDRSALWVAATAVLIGLILVWLSATTTCFTRLGSSCYAYLSTQLFRTSRSQLLLLLTVMMPLIGAVLGYQKGQRLRRSNYLEYLLRKMPEASREAVDQLVREDASRHSTAQESRPKEQSTGLRMK
jgi:hypothetical protein